MNDTSQSLTILFADIGSSAQLYDAVGDAEAHRLVADSLSRMKWAVSSNSGTVLRTVGDSVLASFPSPDHAFQGARAIQQSHQDLVVSVRVGFHTGFVIPDDGDVYGHAVNLAARVAAFAREEEIVATAESVNQLSDEYLQSVSDVFSIDVKGVPESVAVHRMLWRDESAATRLSSSEDFLAALPSGNRMLLEYGSTRLNAGQHCIDVFMGRSEDNQIAVLNDEASRKHAHIQFRHGQFILRDLSTNGTYVRKQGLQAFFVHRDSIVLDGQGVISLGVSPELSKNEVIAFKLIQGEADGLPMASFPA
ncbi:MAG: adenylate/guanylate cyclase domain-containing protein [Granulosicoccus sp.]